MMDISIVRWRYKSIYPLVMANIIVYMAMEVVNFPTRKW